MDKAADCNESDLEEIEARLYSQVHHSKDDVEEREEAGQGGEVYDYSTWRSAFRYFKSPRVEKPGGVEPPRMEERTMVSYRGPMAVHGAFSREAPSVSFNKVLDNFVRPNESSFISERTKSLLFPAEQKKVKRPKCQQRRKGKKQEPLQQAKSIIFISDESDDDCVIIQDTNKDDTNNNDDEDEIIYIPPPPVEVITVDEEVQPPAINDIEANNVNSSPVDSPRKGSPNDFLENYGSEQDFNFGLHGSEFRNQMEFISPNKVPYDCETESSSSTIEPGRSFNNTVKTIVFNEVDFPKGDIFAEKNLDTFESLITTRREADGVNSSNIEEEQSKKAQNSNDNANSRSSSSESDYEVNDKTALPHLSFMHEDNLETSERRQSCDPEKGVNKKKPPKKKKKKNKPKSVDDKNTDTTKKKKKSFVITESDDKNDFDDTQNIKSTTETPKRKKKSSINDADMVDGTALTVDVNPDNAEVDDGATERRKRNSLSSTDNPKKKKKSPSESVDELGTYVESTEATPQSESSMEQKRGPADNTKRKKKTSLNEPIAEVSSTQNIKSTTDCPKRKKKLSINDTEAVDETAPTVDVKCTSAINPDNAEVDDNAMERGKAGTDNPNKKRKPLDESLVTSTEEIGTNAKSTEATPQSESPMEEKGGPADNTKRKKKTSINVPIVEVTDETPKEVVVEHESSSNEVIIVEGTEATFEVIDSCDSDDDDDMRDVIIVESDLNLANCEAGRPQRSLADYDVVEIQRGQSDDPSKWEILDIDRALPMMLSSKQVGPRCKKCRHFGHYAYQCPDKPGPIPCTLCGQTNHQEPRCPEKQCRQCGHGKGTFSTSYCHVCAKYRYVNCSICHMRGHLDSTCPDLWRRYHLTTHPGPLVTPSGPILKPRDQQWCSGCARRGHLEHECNYYNREYPPTTPVVMDYRDTLFDGGVSTNVQDIPSLLLLDIPKPNVTDEERIVVSIPTSSNLKIQIGGGVGGPSAPIGAKKWQPTHDDLNQNYDAIHVKRVIMSHPVSAIKKLLESELAILRDKVAFCSPRLLRDKLYKMEKLKQNEIVFWYRTLNMYVFGVHQCREGKLHTNFIRKVLATPENKKMNTGRRRTLLSAYNYIFGCEKHPNFNYFYTMKRLIQKYDDAQASK